MELYQSGPEDCANPYFAPLVAEDLSNQPDTLILTAEYDPLRDEGEAYGEALQARGRPGARCTASPTRSTAFFSLPPRFAQVQKAYGDHQPLFRRGEPSVHVKTILTMEPPGQRGQNIPIDQQQAGPQGLPLCLRALASRSIRPSCSGRSDRTLEKFPPFTVRCCDGGCSGTIFEQQRSCARQCREEDSPPCSPLYRPAAAGGCSSR